MFGKLLDVGLTLSSPFCVQIITVFGLLLIHSNVKEQE